jgi:uncharacterized iron-regulated membrane protein
MGLTGAVLAFRPQIESALWPKVAHRTACPAFDPDKAMALVNEFVHKPAVDRIAFPVAPNDPFIFQLQKPSTIRVVYDGCSNRVIGIANIGWLDWLVDLHHNLLAGKTGRSVTGALGVALLFSNLSGLFVWVTSSRRRGVTIDSNASARRIVYDLHRSAGLLAALVLIVEAFTGVGLAYPQLLHSALARFDKTSLSRKQQKVSQKRTHRAINVSLADAIRIAQQALPEGTFRELRGLGGDTKQIQARFWCPGDIRSSGNNVVYLNAAGTQVVSVVRFADQPASSRLSDLFTAIHYGEWGGSAARILLTSTGISLALLFVSGFLIRWWPKRKKPTAAIPAQKDELAAV